MSDMTWCGALTTKECSGSQVGFALELQSADHAPISTGTVCGAPLDDGGPDADAQ
jgi:hypothetical protein